jgi:NAD(P)-dependent dehydrogenase (short-subunit alcohol dehydrogenase family)
VVLGIVETEMSKGWLQKLSCEQIELLKKGYPLGFGRPEEVSGIVAFLLSSDSRWIAGQTIVCDGGHLLI